MLPEFSSHMRELGRENGTVSIREVPRGVLLRKPEPGPVGQ